MFYHNFLEIFEEDENIPVGILMEPLIKTINARKGMSFFFQSFDFEFFNAISKHPRLQLKSIILLLNFLMDTYTEDIVFAPLAAGPLMNLINLYIQ